MIEYADQDSQDDDRLAGIEIMDFLSASGEFVIEMETGLELQDGHLYD